MTAVETAVSEDTALLNRSSGEEGHASTRAARASYSTSTYTPSLPLPLTLSEYSQLMLDNALSPAAITPTRIHDHGTSSGRKSHQRMPSCAPSSCCFVRWGASTACILIAIVFMMQIKAIPPCPSSSCSSGCGAPRQSCPFWIRRRRHDYFRYDNGIASYLDLYNTTTTTKQDENRRHLADTPSIFHTLGGNNGASLVVAGKLAVQGGPCNIAQMNLATREWSLQQRIQLSLYNSYSGGEVYSLLSNHTEESSSSSTSLASKQQSDQGSGELIVVGAFDTTYRNSQVTYCSVGKWDGTQLSKVGEGLCNSALSKGMKITTAAFAGPQDVYVAGSFHTQVWNGDRHEFVKIFNIAHFNAVEQVWLPLNVGQITCSWCTVTVLALAWDSKREQLHVAGKFNAIDGMNIPAGLAIYDYKSGHLVAHPGGGLSMRNSTQDGVGTALQFDEEAGVLYVMGSFERLTASPGICLGLAAYEIEHNLWTCLATAAHTVLPTGGNNMLLTPYGLMVAGETGNSTTWPDNSRPYTIALLTSTLKKKRVVTTTKKYATEDDDALVDHEVNVTVRAFDWSWLPGFDGHNEPLHALSNGFGDYQGSVFIAGDNLVAMWSYKKLTGDGTSSGRSTIVTSTSSQPVLKASTDVFSEGKIVGAVMAISQMMPETSGLGKGASGTNTVNYTIIVYCIALGTLIGMFIAIACNKKVTSTIVTLFNKDGQLAGIPLDTLSYNGIEDSNIMEAYRRAMAIRYVHTPNPLTLINSKDIMLYRIIGEGSFGRVWSAKWGASTVAVKEFPFAQAAVAGRSMQQQEIIDSIVGEAGMMAILRHPNVLQLFGCSLTAQAIWIVSELCSLGSLRQLLDDQSRELPLCLKLSLALQVAEGMAYLHNQDPPIIHRDLKSHNIFVHETFASAESTASPRPSESGMSDSTGTESRDEDSSSPKPTVVVKIGDWGAARASLSRGERTMTHGVGTACWMAPETIQKDRSSKYSDVYSYGIILWEIWTREEVYKGLAPPQIIHRVANESLRPPVPEDCRWKELMVRCWSQLPLDRPNFDEIVEELNRILLESGCAGGLAENHHTVASEAS